LSLSGSFNIDSTWTLFLDRDGVINKRIFGDYVKNPEGFEFIDGALEAINLLTPLFQRIVLVTNQQGIGKGVMSVQDLALIHEKMLAEIRDTDGRIDGIFYCPELAENDPICRKPNMGMGLEAQKQFPEIDFSKSIMVGDSPSDIEFGNRLGMRSIFIGKEDGLECYPSLIHFAKRITS
jgi:histidinol-phosphate phosphatase family protein